MNNYEDSFSSLQEDAGGEAAEAASRHQEVPVKGVAAGALHGCRVFSWKKKEKFFLLEKRKVFCPGKIGKKEKKNLEKRESFSWK